MPLPSSDSTFDLLLNALDPDRDEAGSLYEALRSRLIKFFEWRNCESPEELADIVLDRVAQKVADGNEIENFNAYSATVAQFVYKETFRSLEIKQLLDDSQIAETRLAYQNESDDEKETRLRCLDRCLAELSSEDREFIIAYYESDEKTMIAARKRLAEKLGATVNTIRIKACRIKARLEKCTLECCSEGE